MSKPAKSKKDHALKRTASRLEQWIYYTTADRGFSVQYRVRGNTLHLLCRKTPCPDQTELLRWLLPICQDTDFTHLLPAGEPHLYQIRLYGCEPDDKRPRWAVLLYLNQLDHYLDQLRTAEPALAAAAPTPTAPTAPLLPAPADLSALTLSNVALAKRGEEMAIACYLSETLNELGVAVRVSVKAIPYMPPATVQHDMPLPLTTKRLWVACEAAYSPDPSLLSEPITQKLRQLEIEGFHDAVIVFQVAGETHPDWTLRVDLTPPEAMLRDWARWGDVVAIQRLLNQDMAALHLHITTATLNATTLHLCCGALPPHSPSLISQQHKRIKADLGLLLEAIAPQGIHATTIYGQVPQSDTPVWVEWLDLPAAQHPALAESAMALAKQGDWGAIAFLLHRLLNPNLDRYLATGGIRLQLLPKHDLLHVMSEASRCPERKQVAATVIRFLRQLDLPHIAGVRIYGRRAGQKKPLWSYGVDFVSRSRLVPEVTPEFAATDAYVTDLLPQPGQDVIRPDLTPEDIQKFGAAWWQRTVQSIQQILLRSQLFAFLPQADAAANVLPGQGKADGKKIALIWGAAGVLLLLQTNWLLGQVSQKLASQPKPNYSANGSSPAVSQAPSPNASSPKSAASPRLPQADQSSQDHSTFNTSSFTRSEPVPLVEAAQPTKLAYTPRSQTASLITAEILAESSELPSFNSQQLDEKLQLYYRFVDKFGAPDVLIVGSSRALRGIDPLALQHALADVGYDNAKVFNFGINGATAQVVNLLIQHILTQEQLPRMIVWADGARAFNSGAVDVTYNGIVASAAYRELLAGTLAIPSKQGTAAAPVTQPSINTTLTDSYQSIDRWLSQQVGALTGRQTDRDQLKRWLQQSVTRLLPDADGENGEKTPVVAQSDDRLSQILQAGQTLPDETGFLSLAAQFNPATYYQKYARVLGVYDSDYENFRIAGRQEAALQSLLKFTQASQIPVVFVNLPLTEDYLDPVRLEYEQEFRDYMVQISLQQRGFVFRDLSEQWTTQYSYFSDPSHLNRYGAHAVAVKLAQDAKIPWLKPQQTTSRTAAEEQNSDQS